MKKILVFFIILLLPVFIFSSCKNCCETTGSDGGQVSLSLSEGITEELLSNDILLNGTKTKDGYYCYSNSDNNIISFYGFDGKLIWEKEFSFGNPESCYSYNIVLVDDGGFILSAQAYTYQKEDGSWVETSPVLTKCDKNGDIQWEYEYEGFSDTTLSKIFVAADGSILTAGYTETAETKVIGTVSYGDIYFSKISPEGKLISEKYYGGYDFDNLLDAVYIEGKGIAAVIYTQSSDGDFGKTGTGRYVMAFFNEELEMSWYKNILQYVAEIFIYKDNIYTFSDSGTSGEYTICKYNLSGNQLNSIRVTAQYYVPGYCGGIVVHDGNKLMFFDENLNETKEIPFDSGTADKIIEYSDYMLVLSTRITGILPSPPEINCVWHSSELVYSAYDYSGNLLWDYVVDSTPECYKNLESYLETYGEYQ